MGFLDVPHQGMLKFMYARSYENGAKNGAKRFRLRFGDSQVLGLNQEALAIAEGS